MCPGLFSEEIPCRSILVSDQYPYETTKSSHFWAVAKGGSTALYYGQQSVGC